MKGILELANFFGGSNTFMNIPDDYKSGELYSTMRNFYRDRKFTVKDTGVSYRNISNWKSKGVLPPYFDNLKEQEWAKFSLVELVWLKIVNTLRTFGVSLEKISEIRKEVLQWDSEHATYLNFEYQLFLSVCTEIDLYVVVVPGGSSGIISSDFISFLKEFIPGLNAKSFLLISLKDMVREFVFRIEPANELISVSASELKLLKKVRSGTTKKIDVTMKNGKIFEIETSSMISEQPNFRELYKKIQDKKLYGKMTVNFHKGNPESVEVKEKERVR